MKIGNVKLNNNVFLAPMAGITDLAYRNICQKYGCGLVYTEMVSAKALYYKDKKTPELLNITGTNIPTAAQIFGSEPEIMAQMAEEVLKTGAKILDINMGCPAPKIVNNNEGSALMKDIDLAARIINEVSSASKVPVTVKFRKGWDNNSINAIDFAVMAQKWGASAIAIHGRTRSQMYAPKADWDIIKEVKKAVDIPVIGNGDIFVPQDAIDMIEYTSCDAVMIGRAAQGNPFIFRHVLDLMEGKDLTVFTHEDKINQAIEHIRALASIKGEHRGISEARKHVNWYIKGMREAARFKQEVNRCTKADEMINVLMELKEIVGLRDE